MIYTVLYTDETGEEFGMGFESYQDALDYQEQLFEDLQIKSEIY